MSNNEIKAALLELTGLVLDIQLKTFCPTHVTMNPHVGCITITIGYEMERRIDFFHPQYETTMYFFDDWANDQFAANYKHVKDSLEKILLGCLVINE